MMSVGVNSSVYDDSFFDYISVGSTRSAAIVVPEILSHFGMNSVSDIGCGRGAWLTEWARAGIADATGVDGDYVDPKNLLIAKENFVTRDLTSRFHLGRKFDLVTSLEVGEHIRPEATDIYLDNLCDHSDAVLFSAAVPGQGGTYHVNEQTYEFWRKRFAVRGYRVFDFVRPAIISNRQVEPWYRYNSLFFARESALHRLSAAALATEIKPDRAIPILSPAAWRVRNAVIRQLPTSLVDVLIELKHRYIALTNRTHSLS
jgi:SAM-dependent methyltransferase